MSTPCLIICEFTAVQPSYTALFIPTNSPSTLHNSNYCNGPRLFQSHTSSRIFNGDHNHKQVKSDSTHAGNINLYFNIFKLKSVYWQTITYKKIRSSQLFSFANVKSQLVGQPAASNVNMINAPPLLLPPSSVSSTVHN